MRLEGKPVVESIKRRINTIFTGLNNPPVLLTISVNPDVATLSYIRSQENKAKEFGIEYRHRCLEGRVSQEHVVEILEEANGDDRIHGILISHPLPAYLDEVYLLTKMSPEKDVEGRTPINLGKIAYERPYFYPCTAEAVLEMLDFYNIQTAGKNITIIGRSTTVGKPLSWMLLEKRRNATPTLCHTKTVDIRSVMSSAQIIIVAAGFRGVISLADVPDGSTIIDVGINIEQGKIKGDVVLDEEIEVRKNLSITPTPGGVGPVTSILLMEHVSRKASGLSLGIK